MKETFILSFTRAAGGAFKLRSCELTNTAAPALPDKSEDGTRRSEFDFDGHRNSRVLPFVLALVRIAQWHYARPVSIGETVPIFRSERGGGIIKRFEGAFHDATSRQPEDEKSCKWLLRMFSLPGEPERNAITRLTRAFKVSMRPLPSRVLCNLQALPAESVVILIDGEPANERTIDALEAFLSFEAKAGVPFHFEKDGLTVAGRPPSVSAEFDGREDECVFLDKAFEARKSRLLCITGERGSGKSVLSMHWLRRRIGVGALTQKLVFYWTVPNQAGVDFLPFPTVEFFSEFAEALGIKAGAKSNSEEKATRILHELRTTPAIIFLDGIEAMVGKRLSRNSQCVSGNFDFEFDPGVARLLRGIVAGEGGDSLAIVTSQIDIRNVLGIDGWELPLSELPWQTLREIYDLYLFDEDVVKVNAADDKRRGLLVNIHRALDGLRPAGMSQDEYAEMVKHEISLLPPKSLFESPASSEPSEIEKLMANVHLRKLEGKPELVLFYLVSCGVVAPLTETDLFEAAETLRLSAQNSSEKPQDQFFTLLSSLPSLKWETALESLLAGGAFLENGRSETYSLLPAHQRYIATGIERLMPQAWCRIHQVLAGILERKVPRYPDTQEQCVPLAHAAIHRCHAGERRYAFEEICYERLSRKMKAYIIFSLGEYQSPKTVMSALFGGNGLASVSSLPKEAEALCVHVLALCSRYQNQLALALEQEEDAWRRAKLTGSTLAILPVGINLIRIYHIFGDLRKAKEVESKLYRIMMFEKAFEVFGRKSPIPEENIADGAGFVAALLALSQLYRGASSLKVSFLLQAGVKQCRNAGERFEALVPTFGRPWHALTLLEMRDWARCERAIEHGEWGSEMLRYQQTGMFELLTAKFQLLKGCHMKGTRKEECLQMGLESSQIATHKARAGGYTWWLTNFTLVKAQTLQAAERIEEAEETLHAAESMSIDGGFRLLQVDALLVKAQIATMRKDYRSAKRIAKAALETAKESDYGLRCPALKAILKAT